MARQTQVGRELIKAQFINELSKGAASMFDTYIKLLPDEAWSSTGGDRNRLKNG